MRHTKTSTSLFTLVFALWSEIFHGTRNVHTFPVLHCLCCCTIFSTIWLAWSLSAERKRKTDRNAGWSVILTDGYVPYSTESNTGKYLCLSSPSWTHTCVFSGAFPVSFSPLIVKGTHWKTISTHYALLPPVLAILSFNHDSFPCVTVGVCARPSLPGLMCAYVCVCVRAQQT